MGHYKSNLRDIEFNLFEALHRSRWLRSSPRSPSRTTTSGRSASGCRPASDGAYELAREFLQAATGITVGGRQLEEMAAAAASGVPAFYAVPACGQPGKPADRDGDGPGPLGLSADGKGVAMRPESRRRRAKAPGKRVKRFQNRPGTGEKGHKRIAEVACVFDVIPQARTPEQVMACHHGGSGKTGQKEKAKTAKPAPKAVSRRYSVDIAADRSAAIGWLFDEAGRRDPGHARDWVALVDGDNHQIALIEAEAAAAVHERLPGLIMLLFAWGGPIGGGVRCGCGLVLCAGRPGCRGGGRWRFATAGSAAGGGLARRDWGGQSRP